MSDDAETKSSKSAIPDFENVSTFDEMQSKFLDAARSIMFSHKLFYGEHSWKITALELYVCTETNVWRDPYVHKNDEQLESGTWYVHQRGIRRPNWCAPNWSGIDITCGCRTKGIYGGLLIRQICKTKGSATAFKAIIRGDFKPRIARDKWEPSEKETIKNEIHKCRSDADAPRLRLAPCSEQEERLLIGLRIGLPKRDRDCKNFEEKSFFDAPLRAYIK